MDIRVATYSSGITASTVSKAGNPLTTTYVQNAAQSGPVGAVKSVASVPQQSPAASMLANNPGSGGGYTDSIRGSLVNILA
jgi:hypothetical protein